MTSLSICKSSYKIWFSFTREFPCVCSSKGTELLLKILKPYQDNYYVRNQIIST